MPFALGLLALGLTFILSGLKGESMVDILTGKGEPLDPKGGTSEINWMGGSPGSSSSSSLSPASLIEPGGAGGRPTLAHLRQVATQQFKLRITSTTGGTHTAGSYHYSGRAFDAAGTPAQMAAYFDYVAKNYGKNITELFYDPKGAIDNGKRIPAIGGHVDHVHTAV